MKYIITKNQFDLISESQEYLNFLLDKMNDEGYESLNDREKDALVRISKGEEVHDEPHQLPVSDEVYRPNDIFLKYASKYNELEVDDLTFRINPMGGTNLLEVMGEYHVFSIEPNFENNEILVLETDTDDVEPVKFKNVPETTEGMRSLVLKFIFQILPEIIKKKIQ
jgi:hypothetical protein